MDKGSAWLQFKLASTQISSTALHLIFISIQVFPRAVSFRALIRNNPYYRPTPPRLSLSLQPISAQYRCPCHATFAGTPTKFYKTNYTERTNICKQVKTAIKQTRKTRKIHHFRHPYPLKALTLSVWLCGCEVPYGTITRKISKSWDRSLSADKRTRSAVEQGSSH